MIEIKNKILKYKTTLFVIILLFSAKFLGFIKNIFMAKYYGTTIISDAYQMAIAIPSILLGVILYSYQAFTKGYYISEKNNNIKDYTSTFINFILILLGFVSIIIFIFSKQIVELFAPGFSNEQVICTLTFLNPIILGTIFLALSNILAEYLRCKNSYVFAQLAYLSINIIEIITIFISKTNGNIWLSYGYLIANGIYFIILLLICILKKIKYSPFVFKKSEFKNFIGLLLPIFISSIITDLNSMIDKMFASKFETGIISTLSYSTNIKTVFLIIAAGYLIVLFPKISKKYVENKYNEFAEMVRKSTILISIIYILLTIFSIVFSKYIVSFVYYRGAFDENALGKTTICLIMYVLGITGISLRDLYIKALYCMDKGKIVILISIISVIANVIFNIVLSKIIGYAGLPLATSLSVICILPILILLYRKNIKKIIKLECEERKK